MHEFLIKKIRSGIVKCSGAGYFGSMESISCSEKYDKKFREKN